MAQIGRFFRSGRAGWTALAVLLGTALPSARADLITGTDSNGLQVSVLVDFYQGVQAAPLVLTNSGGTVTLSLPAGGSGGYGILFGMKVGNNSLDIGQILNDPSVNLPDPTTGQFSYSPAINGKTYTISGALLTSTPSSFSATPIPSVGSGFTQLGLLTFNAAGQSSLTFSVTDPNGHAVDFADTDADKAPEPVSLALAGIGLVGLAGYGWRRRRTA